MSLRKRDYTFQPTGTYTRNPKPKPGNTMANRKARQARKPKESRT